MAILTMPADPTLLDPHAPCGPACAISRSELADAADGDHEVCPGVCEDCGTRLAVYDVPVPTCSPIGVCDPCAERRFERASR